MILMMFPAVFSNIGVVFLMGVADHWCKTDELIGLNITEEDIKNVTIPLKEDNNGKVSYSQCHMYARNYSGWTEETVYFYMNNGNVDNATTVKCQQGWSYNLEVYGRTATTEVYIIFLI
jgi:uncharacterized protein YciU (UPF0263 family)